MSNDDIADALGTSFIPDESLSQVPGLEDADTELPNLPAKLEVDSTLVAVSADEGDYDTEESTYVREKLRTASEVAGQFFQLVVQEFQTAPTAKMAESASKILDTQV